MKVLVTRNTRAEGKSIGPDEKGKPKAYEFSKEVCHDLVAAGKAVFPPKGKGADD